MHPKLCMHHEHFDLIINQFKYKCENCQVFICPFLKNVMNAKCNSWIMDLAHSNWMIQLMCKCNNSKIVKKNH
jgi:hypothetical protein